MSPELRFPMAFTPDACASRIPEKLVTSRWSEVGARSTLLMKARQYGLRLTVNAGYIVVDVNSGSTDPGLAVWAHASDRELGRRHAHDGPVRCAAFAPDGTLAASGGEDGRILIWRTKGAPPK